MGALYLPLKARAMICIQLWSYAFMRRLGKKKASKFYAWTLWLNFYAVVISVQMGNYEIKELIPEQKNSAHNPHN